MLLRAVAVCCCCIQMVWAQQEPAPQPSGQTAGSRMTANFDAAVKKCDIKSLSASFYATIELVMPEKKQTSYAKAQAEQIIKNFLEENKPLDCVRTHSSQLDNEQSTVSKLLTNKGAFRLTIRMRPIDGALRIFSIRIEEDND